MGHTICAGAASSAELDATGVMLTGAVAMRTFPPLSVTNGTPGELTVMSPGEPKETELTPAIIGCSGATMTPVEPTRFPVLMMPVPSCVSSAVAMLA